MAELPELWWTTVQIQLLEVLEILDLHGEPLIAAYVALALECLHSRGDGTQTGPL